MTSAIEWQPISTASKAADELLLAIIIDGAVSEVLVGGWCEDCCYSDQDSDTIEPTHWFPLKDGGEAYACGPEGVSLRDYFAGQALSALYSYEPPTSRAKELATEAYIFADAMIAVRADF